MTLRIASSKIAVAAALTLGVVGHAAAQASSDRPGLKVAKDAGEVLRIDTVTIYRSDTVRVYRVDTIRVTGPTVTTTNTVTNTVTVYDTTTVEKLPAWFHTPHGVYFGMGGAATYAGGSILAAQAAGYGTQAHLGVDPKGSLLGLRIDGTWNRPTSRAPYKADRSRATIMNVQADLKLRTPALMERFPLNFYALGGGGTTMYKNLLITLDEPTTGTLAGNVADADAKWHDKYSWNYGAGTSVGMGRGSLFAEYRFIDFKAANAKSAGQQALVVGLNWY